MPRPQPDSSTTLSSSSDDSHDSDTSSPVRLRFRIGDPPPLYTIDLSLPPEERYTQLCADFRHELHELVGIYEQVLAYTSFPRLFGYIARRILRKVWSEEETREIKGIAEETGVPLHLVVAYNTFLDLFSGGERWRKR
ncbi:hypothetical protein NLJ89_g10487 [Agrocybe chaxingu]|uniref:ceramidase n=1 Tax=Agrocybe chaxingu TaxID=84603 RepID=A0A9W8JU61_9AGAR|nr:hypothetical protein NLJ89_g10487 [Agrocybe chaxingu]